jgi:ABC-type oligopeptide transport system substrate-binding subunit
MRLWLSLAMLTVGVALMVAAQLAVAAPERKGGVFMVGTTGASVQVDPQLADITTAWWLEYATAAKLYNYPDKKGPAGALLRPEVASGFKVSNGGKRYTFFIRKGFRFSDGTPVTAWNFKYAIERAVNHDLASPAAQFITDPKGTEIVGAKEVNDGDATHVRGVRVKRNRLIMNLTKPDGTFLAKITMPFFQATSTKLPIDREIVDVRSMADLPSAGPYVFTRNDVSRLTSLRRNPYWRRGPGRQRPQNLTGLDLQWNLNEETAYSQVLANQLDEGPLPAAHVQEVANRFGVNKTRFWAMPVNCTGWNLFNNREGIFAGNPQLRKAVSWALDRTEYGNQAGPYAASPWTHLLPPGTPDSITKQSLQPYGPHSNIPRAQELATGHFRDGRIMVAYRSSGSTNNAQAALVRRDLIRMGFDPAKITMRGFSGGGYWIYPPLHGWDLAVSMGWCADYPDPYDYFVPFIEPYWPDVPSYLPSAKYLAKIERAEKLPGDARMRAFGNLDLDLTKNYAPAAFMRLYNNRYLFSDRVDPRSLVFNGVYQDWSIPALALK